MKVSKLFIYLGIFSLFFGCATSPTQSTNSQDGLNEMIPQEDKGVKIPPKKFEPKVKIRGKEPLNYGFGEERSIEEQLQSTQ